MQEEKESENTQKYKHSKNSNLNTIPILYFLYFIRLAGGEVCLSKVSR